MAAYVVVAEALVTAGYLRDADIAAAVTVLEDALIIEEAEAKEAAAMRDVAYQDAVIDAADEAAEANAVLGKYGDEAIQEAIIDDAIDAKRVDKAIITDAEDVIEAAYRDAAAALFAAQLIDVANVDNVAIVISKVWVSDP